MERVLNKKQVTKEEMAEHLEKFKKILDESKHVIELHFKTPIDMTDDKKQAHIYGTAGDFAFSEDLVKDVGYKRTAVLTMGVLMALMEKLHAVYHKGEEHPDHCDFYMTAMQAFFNEITSGNEELEKLLLVARLAQLGGHESINLIKVPIQFNGDMDKTVADTLKRFTKPKAEA